MGSTTSTTKAQRAAEERAEALASLREYLNPGDMVWTVLRHLSSSGMSRAISPIVVVDMNSRHGTRKTPFDLSWLAARAMGDKVHQKHGGVIIGGAGMDMGYHLVYAMSRLMFPDGFDCIGEHCPSNDHVNRDKRTHHPDGGYALRHSWL